CVMGGDIPGISQAHIAHAFKTLAANDVIFGPADDGGYWLVGAKHPKTLPRRTFQNVRWSTKHALADSMVSLHDKRIGLIDVLFDVDTAADLVRLSR
ncbi:MAG: DUF2064 domain-containing protein, partial [Pseudomonadota bacterium]